MKIKITFLFALFSFPFFINAQQLPGMNMMQNDRLEQPLKFDHRKKLNDPITYRTEDLFLGYQTVDLSALNSYLFKSSTLGFSQLTIYGFNTQVFPLQGRSGRDNGIVNMFEYVSYGPQLFSVQDTNYTLTGWQGHVFHLGLDVFPKNKNVDLTLSGGFKYGRMKLTRDVTATGEKTIYTNPLFGLNIVSDLHFNIFPFRNPKKGLGIGGRAGYNLDLSNPKWINKSGGPSGLPNTKLSGYYYAVVLLFYL